MSDRTYAIVSVTGLAIVGVLSAANLWMTLGLDDRVATLEDAASKEAPKVAEATVQREQRTERAREVSGRAPSSRSMSVEDLPLDAESIDDPETREKLEAIIEETSNRNREERRRERSNRWMESMDQEIADFASDQGLDRETEDEMVKITTEMFEQMRQIRDDIRNGDLSWGDAREEFEAAREDSETKMVALIGEEAV